MLPTFFLLCCRCVAVMLKGPFPSDSSTAHADPECLDESDKVRAQFLSFPSTKHLFFPAMPQKDWETWYFDQIFQAFPVFRA